MIIITITRSHEERLIMPISCKLYNYAYTVYSIHITHTMQCSIPSTNFQNLVNFKVLQRLGL